MRVNLSIRRKPEPCGCHPPSPVEYQADSGEGIYLPGLNTVVYTAPLDSRRSHNVEKRRERCREILDGFGFTNWRFEYGTSHEHYWIPIPGDHARLLRENDPPFLFFEDDIEPRDFHANVNIPPCHLAYLGGGRGGDRRGIVAARAHLPFPCTVRTAYRYGYTPLGRTWMRIYGMWFCHALLWLDKRVMLEAADLLERYHQAVDTTYALNQWRWLVLCRRIPLFWQADGHHYRDTYDYDPQDYRAPCVTINPRSGREYTRREVALLLRGRPV
jgi:hypothetical protein